MSLWYYFSMICLVCLKQMAEQFFENGFPLASTLNVSKKLYEYAGRLMAMSLLQVGQNLTILNPRRLWSGTQILYRVNSKRGLYQQNKFFFHILQKRSDEQNSIGSFVKVFVDLMVSHLLHRFWGHLVGERTSGRLLTNCDHCDHFASNFVQNVEFLWLKKDKKLALKKIKF